MIAAHHGFYFLPIPGDGVHRRIDDAPGQRALLARVEGILGAAPAGGSAAREHGSGRSLLSQAISFPERYASDELFRVAFLRLLNSSMPDRNVNETSIHRVPPRSRRAILIPAPRSSS